MVADDGKPVGGAYITAKRPLFFVFSQTEARLHGLENKLQPHL